MYNLIMWCTSLASFGIHYPLLVIICLTQPSIAVWKNTPDPMAKIKFSPVNPSSVSPFVPHRLVYPGWSRVPSAGICAQRTLIAYPTSRGFLYASTSEMCTPLLWLQGPGAENAAELMPEEGTMYLVGGVCRDDFQLVEYGSQGLLACVKDFTTPQTYKQAKDICNASHAHLVTPKTAEKLDLVRSVSNWKDRWVGLDDLEKEGTFVWQSDGTILTEEQKDVILNSGEPNGQGVEHCAVTYGTTQGLNDSHCDNKNAFICEIPLPKLNCDRTGAGEGNILAAQHM